MSIQRVKPFSARSRQVFFASVLILGCAASPLAAQQRGPKHAGKMDLTVSGTPPRKATIDATCRVDEFQPDVTVIEGKSATYFIRFSLIEPKRGTHKIAMEGMSSPDGPHARFDVLTVDKQNYTIPSGSVTLADDTGRKGSIRAKQFMINGSRGKTATFTFDASWTCS